LKNFDKISKDSEILSKLESKGLSIENMKQSFLTTDTQIFNPFYNVGFYFSSWKFVPGLLFSLITIYFFFYRRNIKNQELNITE